MSKFQVNIEDLTNNLTKRAFKFLDVKDQFEKVAFDVYRKTDGNFDELWKLEDGEDGTSYIVALYQDDEKITTSASIKPQFSVIIKNADMNIFYKGDFICKVAASQLGFEEKDLSLSIKYLPQKLADNKKLRRSMLSNLSKDALKNILIKYPELA